MKGLVCKYCGGNHFNKIHEGYQCTYCHAIYEIEGGTETNKRRLAHKHRVVLITLTVLFVLILGSGFFVLRSNNKPTSKTNPLTVAKSSSSIEGLYSVGQLKNPERNVRIAELSLNQESIEQAKASVKEYGGADTEEFEQRIQAAQKEHNELKKKRLREPPKKDMIIVNPNSEFAVTTYYREAGFLAAYAPTFDQYSSADILRIWGKPDAIITDTEQIKKNLTVEFDKNSNPATYEAKILKEQWLESQMTWRELMAFLVIIKDNAAGHYTKQFSYEKQGKPNVYFEGDQVEYVTPILRYVAFTRIPEKYPRAGIGTAPENYGSDGFYHEQ